MEFVASSLGELFSMFWKETPLSCPNESFSVAEWKQYTEDPDLGRNPVEDDIRPVDEVSVPMKAQQKVHAC